MRTIGRPLYKTIGRVIGKGAHLGSKLKLSAPTDLILSVFSDTQNDLSWNSTESGVIYSIERSTDTFNYTEVGTTEEDVTSFSDTGLTAGVTYYYRVRAKKNSSYGKYGYLSINQAWMRYWETNASVNNVYYASPTGTGTTSSFAAPSTVNTALGKATLENDAVVLLPGTYNYVNGTELDYKGIGANGVTLSGLTKLKSDVILDFGGLGDPGGWIYVNGKTNVKIQYLTVKDYSDENIGTTVFYILGDSSGNIQYCEFKDFGRKAILIAGSASQGRWTISKNRFVGQKTANIGAGSAIQIDGNAGYVDVDVTYNVFLPSKLNKAGSVRLFGNPSVARIVNIYNNEFYGTHNNPITIDGHNYTGQIKNNIFAFRGESISGNCLGYADTVNYNFNFAKPAGMYYDPDINQGLNDVNGDYNLKISKLPIDSILCLTFDDASGFDTQGFDNCIGIIEGRGLKLSTCIDVQSWDGLYGGSIPDKVINYINNGHDVGVHSLSHTDLNYYQNALILSSDAAKNVVVTVNNVGSGADWKTINKDYTTWSGSITIDSGGSEEDTLTLIQSGKFLTMEDVKNWIEAHDGWTVQVGASLGNQVAGRTPAICLSSGTYNVDTNTGINVDAEPYIWMQTKYAKDRLETILFEKLGYQYSVKTWGSPFHATNETVMDALMEAGYICGRGNHTVEGVLADSYNGFNFAPYSIDTYGGGDIVSGEDGAAIIESAKISNYLGNYSTSGSIITLTLHTQSFDSQDEISIWESVFDIIEDYKIMGLKVLSLRQLAEMIENNEFSDISGSTGYDKRMRLNFTEQYDGKKRAGSSCADAGLDVGLTSDIEDTAIVLPPNIGAYE